MFTWWFKVTFLGWLSDRFKGLSEPAGVWRVSLAALEYEFVYHEVFIACKSCPPWIYFAQASRTALCTYGVFSASESCVHTHLASHYILGHVEVNRNAHTDNYISLSIWSKIQEVFSSRELTHPTLGKGKSLIYTPPGPNSPIPNRIAKRCYSGQKSNGFLLMIRVTACLPGQQINCVLMFAGKPYVSRKTSTHGTAISAISFRILPVIPWGLKRCLPCRKVFLFSGFFTTTLGQEDKDEPKCAIPQKFIPFMGLVYLPTWTVDGYVNCR